MSTTREQTTRATCPYCGKANDSTLGPDRVPEDGDLSLCASCGGLQIFAADLTTRKPSADELAEIQADKALWLRLTYLSNGIRQRTLRPVLPITP